MSELWIRPRLLVRLEGAMLLVLALIGYRRAGGRWLSFARLFLVPDVSFLGYLGNARSGAVMYNAAHAYFLPFGLGAYGWLKARPRLLRWALIWVAHIAFDRCLGWGLKEPTSFFDTHLDRA